MVIVTSDMYVYVCMCVCVYECYQMTFQTPHARLTHILYDKFKLSPHAHWSNYPHTCTVHGTMSFHRKFFKGTICWNSTSACMHALTCPILSWSLSSRTFVNCLVVFSMMFSSPSASLHVYMCVCVCVYIILRVYIYIYIYIHACFCVYINM